MPNKNLPARRASLVAAVRGSVPLLVMGFVVVSTLAALVTARLTTIGWGIAVGATLLGIIALVTAVVQYRTRPGAGLWVRLAEAFLMIVVPPAVIVAAGVAAMWFADDIARVMWSVLLPPQR